MVEIGDVVKMHTLYNFFYLSRERSDISVNLFKNTFFIEILRLFLSKKKLKYAKNIETKNFVFFCFIFVPIKIESQIVSMLHKKNFL